MLKLFEEIAEQEGTNNSTSKAIYRLQSLIKL